MDAGQQATNNNPTNNGQGTRMNNNALRPHDGIESDHLNDQIAAARADNNLTPDLTEIPPEPLPVEEPKAEVLADDFARFNPARYLSRYRKALGDYRANIRSRALERREALIHRELKAENQHVRHLTDVGGMLMSVIGGVIGLAISGEGNSNVRRLFGLVGCVVLILALMVCGSGVLILRALAR